MSHLTLSPEQLQAIQERQQTARTVSGRDNRDEKDMSAEARAKAKAGAYKLSAAEEGVLRKALLRGKSAQERAGAIPAFVPASIAAGPQKPGKAPEPTEHEIQAAFFSWARPYLRTKGIDPRLLYSVPNSQILMASAKNKHAVMAYLRAEGFTDGIPDIHLDVPMLASVPPACLFHGLRIELKRKAGKASKAQLEVIDLMRRSGYNVCICEGVDEAIKVLKAYLERCAFGAGG